MAKLKKKAEQAQAQQAAENEGVVPHKIPKFMDMDEDALAVKIKDFPKRGVSLVRFIDPSGMWDAIAIVLAAGYTHEEAASEFGVPAENILDNVTPEMITRAKRGRNERIVEALDKIVEHDIMKGNITDRTKDADVMASRRKKLVIDAMKMVSDAQGREASLSSSQVKNKKEYIKQRFGVQEAEIIEEEDTASEDISDE